MRYDLPNEREAGEPRYEGLSFVWRVNGDVGDLRYEREKKKIKVKRIGRSDEFFFVGEYTRRGEARTRGWRVESVSFLFYFAVVGFGDLDRFRSIPRSDIQLVVRYCSLSTGRLRTVA